MNMFISCPLVQAQASTITGVSLTYAQGTNTYTEIYTYADGSTSSVAGTGQSADITDAISANAAVGLTNINAIIELTTPSTTYTGVISGTGTLEIRQTVNPSAVGGSGATRTTQTNDGRSNPVVNGASLTLTESQPLQLPASLQTESELNGAVVNPNPPMLTIDAGVTLIVNGTGATFDSRASWNDQINVDNVLDNGVLLINAGTALTGFVSGTGSIAGTSTYYHGGSSFTGVYQTGIQTFYGSAQVQNSNKASAIINEGSLLVSSPQGEPFVIQQNIYESHFGDDINTDTGTNIFSGVYSNSNNTSRQRPNLTNPGLIDPATDGTVTTGTLGITGKPAELNYMTLNYSNTNYTSLTHFDTNATQDSALDDGGNASFRGINIEGGITQWGDGTTDVFFLPAMPDNSYINLHNGATLAFDYNGTAGPVVLNTPIAGGEINNPLEAVGLGFVHVMNDVGNHNTVVFAQPMYYNGTTTIDAGATLQLGLGKGTKTYTQNIELERNNTINYNAATIVSSYSGDSRILTAQDAIGVSTDSIIDNGTLVINNTENAISLSNISGTGALVQQSVSNQAAVAGASDTSASTQAALMALLPGNTEPVTPTLTLTGSNTYSGGTKVIINSVLLVDSSAALGSHVATLGNDSGDVLNQGILETTANTFVINVPGNYDQRKSP